MQSIYNYTLNQLETKLVELGEKKYRAVQIFEWLYRFRVNQFEQMTNLPIKTINYLKEHFIINSLKVVTKNVASDGTCKYLFSLHDQNLIETVLMRHNYGNSLCVTTQIGCNMGCSFCASGELGRVRNLELSEILLQVIEVQRELDLSYEKITNIVVMGIGEPFDNYENVINFLTVVNYAKGLEIGSRHITVSTCGIVPKIIKFAEFPLQVNLAISLHAPNDELRNRIMKINQKYPISLIINAVKKYIEKTNRRVTFEYILIDGVNDTVECAKQLASLIKGLNAYVNLIPYNEVVTKPYQPSTRINAQNFFETLRKNHIQCTLRSERGSDIAAACGQLRAIKERVK